MKEINREMGKVEHDWCQWQAVHIGCDLLHIFIEVIFITKVQKALPPLIQTVAASDRRQQQLRQLGSSSCCVR